MRSNDLTLSRSEIRERLMQALADNDKEKYDQAFGEMIQCVAQDVEAKNKVYLEEAQQAADRQALAERGVRQLTSAERKYYQALSTAMKAEDPKQALTNTDLVLPTTVLDAVFDELQTSHPLLSRISFTNTSGVVEMLMSENGIQQAVWGKLCGPIVQELLANFVSVKTTLLKLSAFIPVCKATLELGPEWLDNFVRQLLYEALANGLEYGIVSGNGNDQPIGMDRQVGPNVTVTGGVYPEKAAVAVPNFHPDTYGRLLSLLAVDPAGKPRTVRDVILIVNPQDYFEKVMPATTIMTPQGTYVNNVLPYQTNVVQSIALPRGKAILGLAYKYFAGVGMAREGRIEYSDQYQFLEDNRVYLIKLYANGFPMDNNSFLVLDISGLTPATLQVTSVTPPAASTNDDLASLSLGAAKLSPAFAAATTTYTATTTNASNVINAIPADAGATIEITNTHDTDQTDTYNNGAAIQWANGENAVKVKVTAADGTTNQTYTITVTATLGE